MEILPGVGLPVARVGWTCGEIQARVGPPTRSGSRCAVWSDHSPPFAVYFDYRGAAQVVEVYPGTNGHDQPTLHGIPLTRRLMDEVMADLARTGAEGQRTDIVAEYDGFTLWSLLALTPEDLEGEAPGAADDEGVVVEGVGIAPAGYWAST